jgi:hypothetical protein
MKALFLIWVCVFLTACTIYTEKQSQALSRAVYATKDSLDQARVDLADYYSQESTRIVKPPKERIKIDPVFQNLPIENSTTPIKTSPNLNLNTINATIAPNNRRVLLVPERFKNDHVVVVQSLEYEELLKDKKIHQQLEQDYQKLTQFKEEVDKELVKQEQYNNKMILDLNKMQKQLVEKDLAILQRNVIIVGLLLTIGGGIYLRMKGVL